MLNARFTLAFALALAACTSPLVGRTNRAITNGAADDSDLAVAALVDQDGTAYCTATLITPDAVLTAAHCLDGITPSSVFFGASPGAGGVSVAVTSAQMQPDYDPDSHANDVGLVLLAESPGVAPVPAYAKPFDASFVGKTLRLVGFGRKAPFDTAPPQKRTGEARLTKYGERDFSFAPGPSQTCFGDSGGPAFAELDGVEVLIGVTSTGDPECSAGGTDARLDSLATGFIEGYLATAVSPGVRGGCSTAGARQNDRAWMIALAIALSRAASRRRRTTAKAR